MLRSKVFVNFKAELATSQQFTISHFDTWCLVLVTDQLQGMGLLAALAHTSQLSRFQAHYPKSLEISLLNEKAWGSSAHAARISSQTFPQSKPS